MTTTYVTQDRVGRIARGLVRNAGATLDVASPWVEPYPVQNLLRDALPRVGAGELAVWLLYRVAEEGDLRITDLAALEALAAEGVQVRDSRRLHAKLVIADRTRALIGSSNLTRRAGYGYRERPHWRNEEGGVLVEDEATWPTRSSTSTRSGPTPRSSGPNSSASSWTSRRCVSSGSSRSRTSPPGSS